MNFLIGMSVTMKTEELLSHVDHTLLKPEAGRDAIIKLCSEAKEYGFYAVCVNSMYVNLCAEQLAGTGVRIASVIGFPLGAMSTAAKVFETADATANGAGEIDMVIAVGALKDGNYDYVRNDIRAVVNAAKEKSAIVKVILETGLFTDEEIVKACRLAEEAGAAFVKTSTGFGHGGATVHHVELMKQTVGDRLQVKASGGIRDRQTALDMIAAGADRIGASAGIAICAE